MKQEAYLLTGTNLGEKITNLKKAMELIEQECGTITAASSLYETAAWGKKDQPAFLNQAIAISTTLNARQLMRKILKIEKVLGRERLEKYGPRIIDIDILLFGQEVHNYRLLKLPHPELTNRKFALLPLTEIAPELYHPVFKKSIAQLLKECEDPLPVKKL